MCCLRVCKGNFPLRIRRKPPDRPALADLSERVLVAEYAGQCAQKGMEFFGCKQGEGVSLPTDEGDGSFLVAGGAKVSLYLPPWEQGVFWLQEGRGCLSIYHRGGWSFLVAGGARVSLYLPPQRDGVFWLQEGRGCLSTYRRRSREQKNAHPAGGMGGGGRLRAYNWSEADTIRTQCGWVK